MLTIDQRHANARHIEDDIIARRNHGCMMPHGFDVQLDHAHDLGLISTTQHNALLDLSHGEGEVKDAT